jgi:hypothetical protein
VRWTQNDENVADGVAKAPPRNGRQQAGFREMEGALEGLFIVLVASQKQATQHFRCNNLPFSS